jgi:hypothetical protein
MAHAGSWFGLPDFGITEWLQGKKSTSPQIDWGSAWNRAFNEGYNQANSTSNPYTGQAGGGYDIGHAYVLGQQQYKTDLAKNSSSATAQKPTVRTTTQNTNTNTNNLPPDPGGVGVTPPNPADYEAIYAPVFNEYDNMEAALPGYQAAQEQKLAKEVESKKGDVGLSRERELGQLDYGQTTQENLHKSSLRDLTDHVIGLLDRAQNIYGGGSPLEAVYYGIGKEATKARSNLMEQFSAQMADLMNKRSQVESWATEQFKKIDDWKTTELENIKNEFLDRAQQIRFAKASLRAEMTNQFVSDLNQRKNQLENQINAWKLGISEYKWKTDYDLASQIALLAEKAKYNPTAPTTKFQNITINGQAYAFNPTTGEASPIVVKGSSGTPWQNTDQETEDEKRARELLGI